MDLIIVESPTKAKTLKRFLGKGFAVEASMGHVRDLPKSKLSVDVEKNFEPVYEVVTGRGKTVTMLKKLAKEAKTVFLAMDPDREGEAIAFHVKYLLTEGKKVSDSFKKKFRRVTFHEITKSAIEEAMKKPGKVNDALVDAQQARRVLDRLVGYNLSPLLWKKVRRGLSAGRVQSVALKMIVEREKEILAHNPQGYWEISSKLKTKGVKPQLKGSQSTTSREDFVANLAEIAGKKVVVKGSKEDKGKSVTYIESEKEAKVVVENLEKCDYMVSSVERKERQRRAYPPYTTSTLQQAAANVLGWSGKQTMRIAQQLYEAGLITYHRTDSTNLAMQAIMGVRTLIESTYGAEYLPDKPNFYQTKSKSAQEAHEAIRPTNAGESEVTGVNGEVTERHRKLYRLIRNRFIACQMKPAIYDATTILVTAASRNKELGIQNYMLKAVGSVIKFAGWMIVNKKQDKDTQVTDDVVLPEVVEGEGLKLVEVTSEGKETQPPPRYNDASLVKELEKRGIGRPSTYAPIISVIADRGYIERKERRFYPTVVGTTVVDFLSKHFAEVMDYDFTAEMEADLDRVAEEHKDWRKMMREFWKPFLKTVKETEKADRVAIPVEQTGRKCPECKEGNLVIRTGRFGQFISCSRFPECKHTERLVQKLEDFPCPECGGDVVTKRTKKGRTFFGCSNYPKCEYASWKDPRRKSEKEV